MEKLCSENAYELLKGDMLIDKRGCKYLVRKVSYVERYGGYHLELITEHSENHKLFYFEDKLSAFYGCEIHHTKYSKMYELYDVLQDIRNSMNELNDMLFEVYEEKTEDGIEKRYMDDFWDSTEIVYMIANRFDKSLDEICYSFIDFANDISKKIVEELPFEHEVYNAWK